MKTFALPTPPQKMNNRRNFLKLAGLGGVSSLLTFSAAQALDQCDFRPTPKQPLGPFYPRQFPIDSDTDLTRVANSTQLATGQRVIVTGTVTDEFCRPVAGAIVEIWQACESGKYNHPSDTTTTPLDPHFQYYGMMKTNEKGEYSFKTIKPGAYLASENWRRPPHIHYKVNLRGYREVVTQLYFEGERLNQNDLIILDLAPADRKKLVIKFEKTTVAGEEVLKGQFDLTLIKR
ncbi:MAG TPA: protocatechuate 3,4-dioxygenase [Bacteriovoracaceae bacterium]|nr:protocatechuate 3,4-dioxygenase [Bacteriovoracaceae bacterium]